MGSFQIRSGRVLAVLFFAFGATALFGLTNKSSLDKRRTPPVHSAAAEMAAVPAETTRTGPEASVKAPILGAGRQNEALAIVPGLPAGVTVPTLSPSMLALLAGGLAGAGLLLLKRG